jgi:hypothetical protein
MGRAVVIVALLGGLGGTLAVRSSVTRAEEGAIAAIEARRGPAPRVTWKNPGLEGWQPVFEASPYRGPSTPPPGWTHLARPTRFRVPVFDTPEKPRSLIARMRRGDVVPARRADTSRHCHDLGERGTWWQIPDGYICSTSGYEIAQRLDRLDEPQRRPAVHRPLPFRYGHVTTKGAPRFSRRPTAAELAATRNLARDSAVPAVVVERMWDDFFLALDRRVQVGDEELFRTVYGEYVRAEDVRILETPPMRGEKLGGQVKLPLAFVYGADSSPLFCDEDERLVECGAAEKHARFRPRARIERDGRTYLKGPQGAYISSDRVRVARAIPLAPGVSSDERWIHVNLQNQTLVAYEGETPVYATLISSGKETHATPTGLYQVQRKFLTKIMRGNDPKEGIYHVEEVPWTTYYYGAYALHGAYWHNTFGQVRSHGCTNIAPADARWLYYWGEPELRPQFHAEVNQRAMHIHFTDG